MTLVDWHPEDLLDKHYAGALDSDERNALERHAVSCSACRFELMLDDDFEAELAAAGQLPAPIPVAIGTRSRGARPGALMLLLAALVIAGTAAAITRAHANLPRYRLASKIGQAALEATPPARPVVAAAPVRAPAVVPPADDAPPDAADRGAPAPESAAALFARANAARRAGERDKALALYRRLQADHPASPEAKLSRATLGRMLLEDDPQKALDQFEGYLEGDDAALAEEALVGRALSLQRLGDRAGERQAWQQLLSRHPASIHASRAKQRLAELAGDE